MEEKEFKILTIDGGGIRGIYPSKILAEVEAQLKLELNEDVKIHEYFDLICGTSTGGILAIALGLGFSASELSDLYVENARKIFGPRRPFRTNMFFPKHRAKRLEKIIRNKFHDQDRDKSYLLGDSKTRICIPVYDIYTGSMNVFKTSHHESLIRDWQVPAYQVAMATAAAPTFYNPYTLNYKGISGEITQKNKVDGGVCSNNPVLIGFIEAVHGLNVEPKNVKILSIGTGTSRFGIPKKNIGWGIARWMYKSRLIDTFMQSQSDVIDNQIKLINEGIGSGNGKTFFLKRIQHVFKSKSDAIKLDEYRSRKINKLVIAAQESFKHEGKEIINEFFKNKVELYKPFYYGEL